MCGIKILKFYSSARGPKNKHIFQPIIFQYEWKTNKLSNILKVL